MFSYDVVWRWCHDFASLFCLQAVVIIIHELRRAGANVLRQNDALKLAIATRVNLHTTKGISTRIAAYPNGNIFKNVYNYEGKYDCLHTRHV